MTRHDFAAGADHCMCAGCWLYRADRIRAKCAEIAARHWAWQEPANGTRQDCGLAILLMRASMYDGTAPPYVESGEDTMTDASIRHTVASVRRAG